jgi:hypothetical protein
MSENAITFPALAFAPIGGVGERPACERLTWFVDANDFATSTSWELEHWPRQGMVLVDAQGRSWKIARVIKGPVVGPLWGRPLRTLTRQNVHRLEQDLIEAEPLSLEDVKMRVYDAIQTNPDDWRDDEAIAGEAGPPREEQELLDELKSPVRKAHSVPQIINALYGEHLDG